ncbi:hypothetical protein [uncultured Chitinophaga sp.]|uniref:hypothetical protein n=1 Tax=uncultured Chitinophaga sp. TaxID=339340 RepID=UPI0025FC4E8A|nr:hypothetical protein [uncultured Chitinophaga sp.]
MNEHPLIFWNFFKAIETSLSYERWIDKYKMFIDALQNGLIPLEEDLKSFRALCNVLYLQDHRDHKRFNELLDTAIRFEGERLVNMLRAGLERAEQAARETVAPGAQAPPKADAGDVPEPMAVPRDNESQEDDEEAPPPPPKEPGREKAMETGEMYYKTPWNITADEGTDEERYGEEARFLHSDEYFPLNRRNMVKGWQFLRYKERTDRSTELDIPATAFKIAREGLFLEPVYKQGLRNRQDTLIILADVHGSMAPFHELSSRLIYTAQHEGGHARAPVFYFQNFPTAYVYRKPNLSAPVKIDEALRQANSCVTTAVIISDAGAARGNTDKVVVERRQQQTAAFLEEVRKRCAKVLWLNPVPRHRWDNTAAAGIKNLNMVPMLEQDTYNFQDTLRAIFKQKK